MGKDLTAESCEEILTKEGVSFQLTLRIFLGSWVAKEGIYSSCLFARYGLVN